MYTFRHLPVSCWLCTKASPRPRALASSRRRHPTPSARGHEVGMKWVRWTSAILCNGLGRYTDAFEAAEEATATEMDGPFTSVWDWPSSSKPR